MPRPTTTEELANYVGINPRATEGMDVETHWKVMAERLGVPVEELDNLPPEQVRRFVAIYDRGFRDGERFGSS